LDNEPSLGSYIDCTSNFENESAEMARANPPVDLTPDLWVLKLILGAIDPSYDTQDEKGNAGGPQGGYGGPQGGYGGPPPQQGGYGGPPLSRVATVALLSSSKAATLLLLVARLAGPSRVAMPHRPAALQATLASRRTVAVPLLRRGTRCGRYERYHSQRVYLTYGGNCRRGIRSTSAVKLGCVLT
jgi:hypothetical protein